MTSRRPGATRPKSEQTRALILERALALFRKGGFEKTTMRGIAAAAGLSLGAAYYYFPSKEAIVLAYYEQSQDEHAARFRAEAAGVTGLDDRIRLLLRTKLALLARDRRLLTGLFGALFQSVGQPGAALSVFSRETEKVRRDAIALGREALEGGGMPADSAALLALPLWMAQLGLILFFIHDRSRGQQKTHRLVDGGVAMLAPLAAAAASPLAAPLRGQLEELLRQVDLLPG